MIACIVVAEAAKDSTVPVHNLDSEEVGQYTLPGSIFGIPVRTDILHRVVRWQLAKRQQVLYHWTCCCMVYMLH